MGILGNSFEIGDGASPADLMVTGNDESFLGRMASFQKSSMEGKEDRAGSEIFDENVCWFDDPDAQIAATFGMKRPNYTRK